MKGARKYSITYVEALPTYNTYFSLQHIRLRRVLRGGLKHVFLLDNPGRSARRGDRRAQTARWCRHRVQRRRQGVRGRTGRQRPLLAKDAGRRSRFGDKKGSIANGIRSMIRVADGHSLYHK